MRHSVGFRPSQVFLRAVLPVIAVMVTIASPALAQPLFTPLASFTGVGGSTPGELVIGVDGMMYGTTLAGGNPPAGAGGSIFRFDPKTDELTSLFTFNISPGRLPGPSLLVDDQGRLYGITEAGGPGDAGTIFRFDPSDGVLVTLATFGDATNARWPIGRMVLDSSGDLYGVTYRGGGPNQGVLFKWDASTGILAVLVEFNGSNGTFPNSGLVQGGDGFLYGTTEGGGAFGLGTVFRFDPHTDSFSTLVSFDGANGSVPSSLLYLDSEGKLIGTTAGGGSGFGTIFGLDPDSAMLTTLAEFNGGSGIGGGRGPSGRLVPDGVGNIYGVTESGGATNRGTIYRFSPLNNTISTLLNFTASTGPSIGRGLLAFGENELYGTTNLNNTGLVYRLECSGFIPFGLCPGDANGDGIVNFVDLNTLLAAFGSQGAVVPGDVNFDCVVNFTDLNDVLANFGLSCK